MLTILAESLLLATRLPLGAPRARARRTTPRDPYWDGPTSWLK